MYTCTLKPGIIEPPLKFCIIHYLQILEIHIPLKL